ncbi:hypothetical protein I4U23_027195 [Adineta vaga]|nr:hypothetical protein I4U23_027195 [Adineta vaga]
MANNETQCSVCNEDKVTYLCEYCLHRFCLNYLNEHQQKLNEELKMIINDFAQIRENINKKQSDLLLMKQIDRWETNSEIFIRKISIQFEIKERNLDTNLNKWKQNAEIIEGNGDGNELN